MDEATVRAALHRYWQYAPTDQDAAHAMYHDDKVGKRRRGASLGEQRGQPSLLAEV